MDILGIGPMELILILIVALAVFGPDKLPSIGAKLGKAMRDMRKATRAFSEEIGAPAREIMEPFQEASGAVKSLGEAAAVARNPGEAIRQSVVKELKAATDPAPEPAPEAENRIAPPELVAAASAETAGDKPEIAADTPAPSGEAAGPAAPAVGLLPPPPGETAVDLTAEATADPTANEPTTDDPAIPPDPDSKG